MDVYLTEAEQIEQIKQWWKKNGTMIVISIVVALLASFGWRYWEYRHERSLTKASVIYERLLNSLANNENDNMEIQADRLMDHYRHTPYAEVAALMLARQAVYNNDLATAESNLKWVMKHGDNKALRQLARIRAARVLLAENKPSEALELLQKVDDPSYLSSTQSVLGDIYLSLGKTDEARKSYSQAITATPGIEVMQPLLQMKLDNLSIYSATD